jgi:DNA invertase Pin-like site-specific DNA recombinase
LLPYFPRTQVATYLHEARSDVRAHTPSAARQVSNLAKLRAGDTLVVGGLGSLGDNYADISRRMHDLMRRGISVRAINEGLSFDGSVEDVEAQASRDALIAMTAAAAESNRTAQRLAAERQAIQQIARPEPMAGDTRGAVLQLRTVGVQLGALAAAVYLGASKRRLLSDRSWNRRTPGRSSRYFSPWSRP